MKLGELERKYPTIPWREPIQISIRGGETGYACRVCIARAGLKASRFEAKSYGSIKDHIREEHIEGELT